MEETKRLKTCCFFGHRKTEETDDLKEAVRESIEDLIVNNGVNVFLFGSKSKFDDLCHRTVTNLKKKYPHLKRVYVRAEFPYINEEYRKYLLEKYEDTYYPENIINAGKAAYVERNCEMIDKGGFCIIYYDEAHRPEKRKSGTKIAYEYAVRKNLNIKNMFKKQPRCNSIGVVFI